MQGFCVFVVLVSMVAIPVSFVLWVVKKLRKKETKKAKQAFFVSLACCVVFSVVGALTAVDTCDHKYELVESEAATCEADGFEKYHCDLCGLDKTETVDKLGHDMVDGVCSRCGYTEETEKDDDNEVSSGAQMVLSMIAEDMAKQVAQNPGTVKMSIFSQGFYKDGHTYAVQSDFTCSNLMGVKESHTIKVIAVSNEDESKISPTEVYLDGELIWVREE